MLPSLGGPRPGPTSAPAILPPQVGLIQGRKPASVQEWYVAVALWEVGWQFHYQVPIRGGGRPGGQFLDFLVMTVPRPTPLQPFSTYYHRGHLGVWDRWKLSIVKATYGVEPVVWWSDQIDTQAKAVTMVKKTFGYP